ncbi:MAG: adenylate/guanylate cyclase domain-containing protein [Burkholderiales bacterium]|nr:adenylate/guanylate cyclase domain-containing protein [Burkholderiales bacterium]
MYQSSPGTSTLHGITQTGAPAQDGARNAERAIARRYLALMSSAALVAVMLGAISAYATGSVGLLPELLAWTAAVLLALNLLGAVVLYRPLGRHLKGDAISRARLETCVRRLPIRSGLWVFALAAIAMLGYAGAAHGSWQTMMGASWRTLASTLVHVAVFAVYLGLYAYLLALGFTVRVRRLLWERGEPLQPHRGRFAARLVAVVTAVALGPLLVVLADQWAGASSQGGAGAMGADPAAMAQMRRDMMSGMSMDDMRSKHRRYMTQSRQMDLLAALLLAALLAYLATRGLSRSADGLLRAMDRVDEGDLSAKAPVVSDDEFGRLTERFNRMLDGLNERERLRRTFERFVPETIAGALVADEGAIAPQEREATVLFTDIERFTQIAAALAPREIMMLLNAYFSKLAEVIHRHHGVITQFQGDAVLASFNLPVTDPEHARSALAAALEIEREMQQATFGSGVRLRTRIGISTGLVVGGTVGGGERLGYTVHGDTVNLAARLEALNKDLGTTILLSGRTAALLAGAVDLRRLGLVEIRGFPEPLDLYTPSARGAVP